MENVERIWNGLCSRLKSFIYSKIHDSQVADDILQEAFIRLHSHIDSLKSQEKIIPWMFQITRNLISDHYRRQQTVKHPITPTPETGDEPYYHEMMDEAVRDMIHMMEKLPPESCTALCATDLEGLSQKAYAKKEGIPYSTVKSRVQRARIHLRELMMQCCHYQFDTYGTILAVRPARTCCCCLKKNES